MRAISIIFALLAASIASADGPVAPNTRFATNAPSTTNNDDSCDVATLPAATLLLPYFEVDLASPTGETTIFAITNVTQSPQIARVTLWTDWSYPVFSFDIFLTGYDVQSISLFDVLSRGHVAPPFGTSSERFVGDRSLKNDRNLLLDISKCDGIPIVIPPAVFADMQSALTTGLTSKCGTARVGGTHAGTAIGYATIDLVRACDAVMPTDPGYFTSQILFDNVLVGDYQQIDVSNNFAQGGTLVHIRAIPEGGTANPSTPTFDRTFYSRFQNGGTTDRRQPLPSTFVARWISGGVGAMNASFKIWREGSTGASADCAVAANARNEIVEIVRFDEEENPTTGGSCCIDPEPPLSIPSASRIAAGDTLIFPPNPDDVAGWMYMNLDDGDEDSPVKQSWAIISMAAEGRFSVDLDAASLGNGCSPAVPPTDEAGDEPAIGPAPNDNGAKASALVATTDNDDSCDIIVAPAATLLLPHFEVGLALREEDTLFTITNVSRQPQIAYVTLWTDYAYPVIGFNVFLTGYDTHSISLFDVLSLGIIGPSGGPSVENDPGIRSVENGGNALLDITNCDDVPAIIPAVVLTNVQRALTLGTISACGPSPIGGKHERATGYVTVDLVASCDNAIATESRYFTEELLYDNVLIGDYQHVDRAGNFAQSGTMVHIRAIPEGGADRATPTNFARTFYGRFQNGGASDRRQPLPSTFASRWISGGPGAFNTAFTMWREALTGSDTCFLTHVNRDMAATEIVRFDEEENPVSFVCSIGICAGPRLKVPPTIRASAADFVFFPPNAGGDIAGWMYFNLDNESEGASSNWVTATMVAEGRYSTEVDASALGNGCSPPSPFTAEDGGPPILGPPPNGD